MSGAVHDNWTYAMKHNMNFRDACLVNAMNKIEINITAKVYSCSEQVF
jgi:hypothetical protein